MDAAAQRAARRRRGSDDRLPSRPGRHAGSWLLVPTEALAEGIKINSGRRLIKAIDGSVI